MNPVCITNLSCNSTTHQLFIKNGIPVIECDTCHHRYAEIDNLENHLEEVYSDEYFFEGRLGYPNYLENKDLLIKAGIRLSWKPNL